METELKTLRHEIEENRLGLHPYVRASIENWERHEDCKYTAFGHHKYSSAASLASVTNLSREQAEAEMSRCRRRNAKEGRGLCCCRRR